MTDDQNSSAKSVASYSSSQQNTPMSTQSKLLNVSAHLQKVPPAPNLSPMGVHPTQANQGGNSVTSSNASPLSSPSHGKDNKIIKPTVGVFDSHATTTTTATTKTTSSSIDTGPKVTLLKESPSSSAEAVLLGIESLERQQEELERKRQMSIHNTPQRPVERHNPFDDEIIASESKQTKDISNVMSSTPQTAVLSGTYNTPSHQLQTRQRMIPHQPQDHQLESDHHVPRTVQHGGIEVDDEITMESDQPLTLQQHPKQTSLPLHKRSRTGSFGSFASKIFKTPMVSDNIYV